MPLSTSRQQFLAYESHAGQDIHYGRKGGIFISTCVCISFVIFAVLVAVLVGIIVYYITFFKISQKSKDFWDDSVPFGQSSSPLPDLRLPSSIAPSFYRLKIKADLETSRFSGDVYITIRANKKVKEIILHSKNLNITSNATLTEQIYQKVESLHSTKVKREANETDKLKDLENNKLNTTENSTDDSQHTTTTETSTEPQSFNASSTEIPQAPVDTQVTHSYVRNIKIISMEFKTGDRLVLTLASVLTPDVDYTLQLSFEGDIANSLTGFYKSTYTDDEKNVRSLAATQFEPTSARAAFPCFDEPAFKAKFEISIAHRENVSVLSNMRVATEEPIESDLGWKWTHFERSVDMSTYLVAYVLSDFKNVETSYISKDNVSKPIRIWTRPNFLSKANYALTIVPKLLSYYEDVFGVTYALDKLDLIAIPDFSSGAMENWGLITFRETTLLFDEKEGTPRDKQNVAIDVAHELAHQWFGNLVTMKWWTDLWLNEGFATYIEYLGVDHIAPEWNMLESFTRDKMNLLRTDALKNTSPVSLKVIDASEISQKFDEISYTKGANLIRMLNHTISEKLFHEGLVIYLNKWKYRNAEENNLWDAMSLATKSATTMQGLHVTDFMNSWTRQAGYPVVNVQRNYDTGFVVFEQELFTSPRDTYKKKKDQTWRIPISYTTLDTPVSEWSTQPQLWLNFDSVTTNLPVNSSQALYVNVDAIGYYRVNYDQKNWELLSTALKSKSFANPVTKAQLIDDAFNLAKSGQLNYNYALGLTTCVIDGENSTIVWDLLLNNMAFLKHNLKATSGYLHFQDYMKIILRKQLEKINYGLNQPKDDKEVFFAENLVGWECLIESQRCLDWAKSEFDKWMANPTSNDNPKPNYLKSLVYAMAIKHGGRREFEFLWNMFKNSTDPTVKDTIITTLPSTRVESLITFLLEKSLTELPNQHAASVWNVDAPIGTMLAQHYLIDNFDRVYDKFTKMDSFMFPSLLQSAFGFITTEDELDRLKNFAMEHKEKLLPMSQTLQKIVDSAELRIRWIKKYAASINEWFKDFVEKHKDNTKTNKTADDKTGPVSSNDTISSTNSTESGA